MSRMYLWILGSLLVAVVRAEMAVEATSDRAFSAFLSHLQRYSVTIGDGSEFASRLDVYKKNDEYIALSNARNLTYTLGHNQFSHLTHAEFLETFKLGTSEFPTVGEYGTHRTPKPRAPVRGEPSASTVDVPTHVDWTKAGAVTRVKNQGACGSCWAFSATGSLEGAYAIATTQNVADWPGLSEQELVSCDRENMGCDGGNVGVAYRWVEREAGLCQEKDYPYSSLYDIREYPEYPAARSRSVSCNRSCDPLDNTAPVSHVKVEPTELALLSAIGDQPVSVAIDASDRAFQHYSSGIYDGPCGSDLDHAVLATGYGVEVGGSAYWTVKNSWGTSWGMGGYIKLARTNEAVFEQSDGQCGILMSAAYPVIKYRNRTRSRDSGPLAVGDRLVIPRDW